MKGTYTMFAGYKSIKKSHKLSTEKTLVIELPKRIKTIAFQVQMQQHNNIKGLLPMKFISSSRHLHYEHGSLVTLSAILMQDTIPHTMFVSLLLNITRTIKEASDYGLKSTGFALDADYIYIDQQSQKCYFIHLPISTKDSGISPVRTFVNNLLTNTQQTDNLSPPSPTPTLQGLGEHQNDDYIKQVQTILNDPIDLYTLEEKLTKMLHTSSIDTTTGTDATTEILEKSFYLECSQNGNLERIPLNKETTLIGRKVGLVDYVCNSKSVSNFHASFKRHGNEIIIQDTESTNGTYINDIRLSGKLRLSAGDKIRLADVEFVLAHNF